MNNSNGDHYYIIIWFSSIIWGQVEAQIGGRNSAQARPKYTSSVWIIVQYDEYTSFYWICLHCLLLATESQSDRVIESQKPSGTQNTGGWNFFVPNFNKLPFSLRSQGDNNSMIFKWVFFDDFHLMLLSSLYLNWYYLMIFTQYSYQCSLFWLWIGVRWFPELVDDKTIS